MNQSVALDTSELRTEAAIVLRTVEHITFDLDHFSKTIRAAQNNRTVIDDIERHLGQARRNCAAATTIAERIIRSHDSDVPPTQAECDRHTDELRDAFAELALADSAYLRAFEVASPR
jgi:hypothetical protein